MKKSEYPLFSNGTEAYIWIERNCEKCIKGTFYNEKLGRFPKYRCAILKHIDEAWFGDGRGNERTYKAVRPCIVKRRTISVASSRKENLKVGYLLTTYAKESWKPSHNIFFPPRKKDG